MGVLEKVATEQFNYCFDCKSPNAYQGEDLRSAETVG